ncbi:hypothetical protein, partial [Paraburkholderia sediminicola]|uniref:hypothetical protein n=1 Tax=Paraburkholderia sediminicola TaxID=458836 RepID=UPI0038B8D297
SKQKPHPTKVGFLRLRGRKTDEKRAVKRPQFAIRTQQSLQHTPPTAISALQTPAQQSTAPPPHTRS